MKKQEPLVSDLKRLIEERDAVCILGAGVSIAATQRSPLASWPGLLRNGVERCMEVVQPRPAEAWRNSAIADIETGVSTEDADLLISAAGKIESKLKAPAGPEFGSWLRDSVGSLRIADPCLIEKITSLGLPIITTNYDSLFEEYTKYPAITARDSGELERVLRGSEQGIIHMHGWWKHPETVVLGARSYERIIVNKHMQAILRSLSILKTLVFIGFGSGLDDPHFDALFNWIAEHLSSSPYRRYRFARTQDLIKLQAKSATDSRLFIIDHGTDFATLPSFIDSLTPQKAHSSNTRAANSDSATSQNRVEHIRRVTRLLEGVQNTNLLVSQLLVECLSLAHESGDFDLEYFCRGELDGWSLNSESEIKEKDLSYRLVDIYLCVGAFTIDIDAAQFRFRDEDALFDYFKSDKDFKHQRHFLDMPVATLEERNKKALTSPGLAVYKFEIDPRRFFKNVRPSEFKFIAYAKSNAISRLLGSVRQRLTKRLLRMLPTNPDSSTL